ncbi:hypothetical protein Tco_0134128 [Tanacetum coccineum]
MAEKPHPPLWVAAGGGGVEAVAIRGVVRRLLQPTVVSGCCPCKGGCRGDVVGAEMGGVEMRLVAGSGGWWSRRKSVAAPEKLAGK